MRSLDMYNLRDILFLVYNLIYYILYSDSAYILFLVMFKILFYYSCYSNITKSTNNYFFIRFD